MDTFPPQVDVLIVGAGPSGLAAALALRKQGCTNMLVVDGAVSGENTSRAVAVHAATLEALDELGCAEALIDLGLKTNGGRLWDGHRFHPWENYSILAPYTKYPFILFVPQHITERVLGERAQEEGINVRRPHKLIEVKVNATDSGLTDAVFEDGQVVKARYVVGADGSKSTVRGCAGIGYADPDGDDTTKEGISQAVVADVTFTHDAPFGPADVMFILSSGNFLILIALPPTTYDGQKVWRIGAGVPSPMGTPPRAPSKDYMQGVLDAYGPTSIPASAMPGRLPIQIEKVIWSARFRMHSAIAETPFTRLGKGSGAPVVLIGDAAHLHPPTGGQGMNLGLRDAVFLAPVLVEHLHKSENVRSVAERDEIDKSLRKWADWRHAQALKIIALAKGVMRFATWKDEIRWYFGIIPINWFTIRSWMIWFQEITGLRARNPFRLSGLYNR